MKLRTLPSDEVKEVKMDIRRIFDTQVKDVSEVEFAYRKVSLLSLKSTLIFTC